MSSEMGMLGGGILLTALVHSAALAQGSPRSCGVERWPVKVAIDDDASRIDTARVRSTVAALGALPRPLGPFSQRNRNGRYEVTVYRVIAAIREVQSPEDDGDLHIVLEDLEDPARTLIAEVPDSACALGSRFIRDFATAYRAVRDAPARAIVVVDGVGFFDRIHGQTGVAPNGFELHPVVALRVVGQRVADRADSTATPAGASTKVWVNTASRVYHCPGTRYYGATQRGRYMSESEAMAAGARPAYGRRCGR